MTPETVAERFHLLEPRDREVFGLMADTAERFQRRHNPIYAAFEGFRYLPVEAFKRRAVTTFDPEKAETVFLSSGTGGPQSRHYVRNLDLYLRSVTTGFERRFGDGPFVIAAHLPGYAPESSLVRMLRILIEVFGEGGSGFFLDDPSSLDAMIQASRTSGHPLMLFGVAFGLLDLAEGGAGPLPTGSIVIETGGMKTTARTILRPALHERLSTAFGTDEIVSEYGMCELLSQCWTDAAGIFRTPPWMDFDILDPMDPSRSCDTGNPGALAVFDLANLYSVSAVLTQDRAIRVGDGFEVLGRLDGAELRGCNFLLERHVGH